MYIYHLLLVHVHIPPDIITCTYTIVNRNIKEPTGRIYGIYPRPQGSYTTAGKLYNHIKVCSRVQQPYIIPGMTSRTCAVTERLQRMKAMKRVRQVNTQKKLSFFFKKRTNRWAFLPGTIRPISLKV